MSTKGILPDILDLRGPLLRSPGGGGTMAVSTSPSTMEISIQGAFGIGFGISFPAGISGKDFPL